MSGLFKGKTNLVDSLLNVKENEGMLERITKLQNEINVEFDSKIIAVATISDSKLSAALAKALADTYDINESTSLIIDANLYDPCLMDMINVQEDSNSEEIKIKDKSSIEGYKVHQLSKNTKLVSVNKQKYPANFFKNKVIESWIKNEFKDIDHIIIVVPTLQEHKEILLLKDVLKCGLLVTQRGATKKKDIFEAISYFKENDLPLASTVILK